MLVETGLTCSCGVAPNRMLAKVCSDINKPNGQCVVPADPNEIRRFVDDLPIRKVPGIGKVYSVFFLLSLLCVSCIGLVCCQGRACSHQLRIVSASIVHMMSG